MTPITVEGGNVATDLNPELTQAQANLAASRDEVGRLRLLLSAVKFHGAGILGPNIEPDDPITPLRVEVERLRGLLKSLEWMASEDHPGWQGCPSCDVWGRTGIDELVHLDTCALAAELKEDGTW